MKHKSKVTRTNKKNPDLNELARLARNGDSLSQARLIRIYGPVVKSRNWKSKQVQNEQDIDSIINDSFKRFFTLGQWDPAEKSFESYFGKIVWNAWLDWKKMYFWNEVSDLEGKQLPDPDGTFEETPDYKSDKVTKSLLFYSCIDSQFLYGHIKLGKKIIQEEGFSRAGFFKIFDSNPVVFDVSGQAESKTSTAYIIKYKKWRSCTEN